MTTNTTKAASADTTKPSVTKEPASNPMVPTGNTTQRFAEHDFYDNPIDPSDDDSTPTTTPKKDKIRLQEKKIRSLHDQIHRLTQRNCQLERNQSLSASQDGESSKPHTTSYGTLTHNDAFDNASSSYTPPQRTRLGGKTSCEKVAECLQKSHFREISDLTRVYESKLATLQAQHNTSQMNLQTATQSLSEELTSLQEQLSHALTEISNLTKKNRVLEKEKNQPKLSMNWTKYDDVEYDYDRYEEIREQRNRIDELRRRERVSISGLKRR
jgi:hypothetical protein